MKGPTPAQRLAYAIVRGSLVGFSRIYWRLTITGKEHLPDGPYVVAPVHRSNIDTLLVAGITTRRLRYMGKDSLWKYRLPGWMISALGAFPVKRGVADRAALRTCLEVLSHGEPLVIYPEGGRRSGPVVGDISEGAAYLALRAGVPLVPVGIGGSERAMTKGSPVLRPVKTALVIGPPIPLPTGEGAARAPRRIVREVTEQLRDSLQDLLDQAQGKAGVTAP
ncbi:MAG: lysophospholipid acyltransferase family protein [Acidimicrobiales bacterium]